MLSADVRFEGFTQSDWARVLSLFRPRVSSGKERDPERPQGGVVAVTREGRLIKLLHTQAGRLRLDELTADWPLSPEVLAQRHHASFALVIESGALESVMESFGARVRRGDDLTAQTLLFAALVREELVRGTLAFYPARLAGMPMPTAGMIERSIDAVCPRSHAMVFGLFDAGELWTTIALYRGASGRFESILGPDEIRRDMGLLAGDFRRDYRHLSRAVERRIGKLSMGVFSEMSTFRALQVDPTPGAWARAAAIRDVILSPVPVALTIPLGLDAGRAAFSVLRSVAERAQGMGVASPLFGVLRESVDQLANVASSLPIGDGERFDLLELIRRLLSRER